ncbi:MAG: hypothetical protein GEU96_16000 [Propionibacteriales bacterium]|nr:hypothetical protein [Propionibacteriales bacterium]
MQDLVKDFVRAARFTPVASFQRFAYVCGGLLVLSGVFHAGVYLVDGGPWEGPVSWRKPVVFGLSFGITLVTLTWIMTFIRPRKAVGWVALGALAVASLGEVFLISMQKWRGVASHFNEDTSFDTAVFSAMGFLVMIVGLMTLFVAVRSFFSIDAPSSLAWAIRTGLVLMLVSQAIGVQMIVEGGNTFGADGALKMPHAFTLHAVQVLPALALVLSLSESSELRRLKVVALGAAGYVGLIASTVVQTYGGRGPLDLGVVTSVLALVGLGLLVASAPIALRGLGSPLPPTTALPQSSR